MGIITRDLVTMKTDDKAVAGLEALLGARRSVRGFLPDPVPPETIERVLTMAQRAPSNCNAQPWIVHILGGQTAERVRSELYDLASRGAESSPDFPITSGYADLYRERQIAAAKALFAATGVGRDDMEARRRSTLRNFRFFDAPHAALVFVPDWAGMREAADCGMYVQSLLLALTAHGIGSCVQAALSRYAEPVREILSIDRRHRLLLGISFGFENVDHPANTAQTSRAPIEENVVIHG